MRKAMRGDESLEYGRVYRAIERALWTLGPALILLMALNIPSLEAAHQQAEEDIAVEIASENQEYCAKWGMSAVTPEHADCIRDLLAIRGRAEQRVRDQIAADF